MKKIFLHVGCHKTGTSSIQKGLCLNEDKLLKRGVLYPKSGRINFTHDARFGHHHLAWSILKKNGYDDERIWEDLRSEIDASSAEFVIISSEEFERFTTDQIKRVKKHLHGYEVEILIYFRNQLKYMYSTFSQRVKAGNLSDAFEKYLKENVQLCNYTSITARWAAVFCKENLSVKIFEKEKANGLLINRFCKWIGIEDLSDLEELKNQSNVSPKVDTLDLVRQINWFQFNIGEYLGFEYLCYKLRRCVIRQNWVGKTLKFVFKPLLTKKPYGVSEIDYIRSTVDAWNKEFLKLYVPAEDRDVFII